MTEKRLTDPTMRPDVAPRLDSGIVPMTGNGDGNFDNGTFIKEALARLSGEGLVIDGVIDPAEISEQTK